MPTPQSAAKSVLTSAKTRIVRAFTLVELLVVIGIIAVLISLLLPALNNARAAANQLVCVSNLRQISQALFSYIQDNHGSYPYTSANGYQLSRCTWCNYFLSPYLGNKPTASTNYDSPVMRCPSDERGPLSSTASNVNNYWGNVSYMALDLDIIGEGGSSGVETFQYDETAVMGGVMQCRRVVQNTGQMTQVAAEKTPPSVSNPIDYFPRGDNPYIVEGSTPSMNFNGGTTNVPYWRIPHGTKRTKMNFISVDLSVMTVDFAKANNLSLHMSTNPTVSTYTATQKWNGFIGYNANPYMPGSTQVQASGSVPGGYLLDWPYRTVQRDSTNLLKAQLSSFY